MGKGYAPQDVIEHTLTAGLAKIYLPDKLRRVVVYAPAAAGIEVAFTASGPTLAVSAGGYYDTQFLPETSEAIDIYVKGTGTAKVEIWRAI